MRHSIVPLFILFLWWVVGSTSLFAQNTSIKTNPSGSSSTGRNVAVGGGSSAFGDSRTGTKAGEESESSGAKKGEVALRMKVVQIDETLGEKTASEMDTLPLNYQNMAQSERNTVAASYMANIGSAFQSMVYTDRRKEEQFIFMQPYDHWKTSIDEWRFINTTRPYTNGTYLTTVANNESQEENFKFYFTANFNKYLNVGVDYEAINARGYYKNLASRDKMAHLFGNYQSPRYEAFARLSYHRFENYENGGITNDNYITKPLEMSGGYREYESKNIPIALDNTFNLNIYRDVFFNQKYHLGFNREEIKGSDTTEVFVPVTSLIHTFQIDHGRKNYDSRSANAAYYDAVTNIDNTQTADSVALTTVRNVLGLSLQEGFHPWMKFGLTAYAEHEYRNYAHISSAALPDSSTLNPFRQMTYHKENLIWVGGRLVSSQDSLIQFHADAKFCMIGYTGNFDINGELKSHFRLWQQPVNIMGEAFVKNETPDYFLRHYYSNHFSWNQDLDNVYRVRVGGRLEIPRWGMSLKAGVENISNYVYFNKKALPTQHTGQLQVLYAQWKQHLNFGVLNIDMDAVGQLSSDERVLPLPTFAVYGNVYLKTLLSKVMTTQVGVDCRYYTAYYVPAYMPAIGQYHVQEELKIGNYPYMNVYANFHLKRARFFVMYAHGSRWFATPNYFNVLHYPLNPSSIKAGLSWNFYD